MAEDRAAELWSSKLYAMNNTIYTFVKRKALPELFSSPWDTNSCWTRCSKLTTLIKTYPNKRVTVPFSFFPSLLLLNHHLRLLVACSSCNNKNKKNLKKSGIHLTYLSLNQQLGFRARWDLMIMNLSWKRNCKLCPRPCNQLFMWVTLNSAGVPTGINFLTGEQLAGSRPTSGERHTAQHMNPLWLFILLFLPLFVLVIVQFHLLVHFPLPAGTRSEDAKIWRQKLLLCSAGRERTRNLSKINK